MSIKKIKDDLFNDDLLNDDLLNEDDDELNDFNNENSENILTDNDFNNMFDKIYLPSDIHETRKILDNKWIKLVKYHIDNIYPSLKTDIGKYLLNNHDKNQQKTLRFFIKNGSNINLTTLDSKSLISLNLGKAISQIIYKTLFSENSLKNYRLKISYEKRGNNCVRLYMRIYINKQYLEYVCRNYKQCPYVLKLIISDRGSNYCNKYKAYTSNIKTAIISEVNDLECEYLKYLNITPYTYQKNNIDWMYGLEKKVDLGINQFNYLITTDYLKYKIDKYILYMDPISEILYDDDSLWKCQYGFDSIQFKGGVICDEVGLGKTLSTVSLALKNPSFKLNMDLDQVKKVKKVVNVKKKIPVIIKKTVDQNNNQNSDQTSDQNSDQKSGGTDVNENGEKINKNIKPKSIATLIFCPSRLCQQWEDEIDKYLKPEIRKQIKVLKITTKTQLDKCSLSDICNTHFLIVSYQFLINKNYYQNQSRILFDNISWHRVVIDEGHEVLLPNSKKKNNILVCKILYNIDAKYKWCCTGDPLAHTNIGFQGIVSFLTGTEWEDENLLLNNITSDIGENIIDEYFRRNTKLSTKEQVSIPKIKENVIYLDFSPTERAVYNNANGNKVRMMQLCTNILISDYDSNIVGKKIVSMNEINSAMSDHYREQAYNLKNNIKNTEEQLITANMNYPIELQEIEDAIKVFTDKQDILHKKKKKLPNHEAEELDLLKNTKQRIKNRYKYQVKHLNERIVDLNKDLEYTYEQIKLFTGLNINQISKEPCSLCGDKFNEIIITKCGHIFCDGCLSLIFSSIRKYADCPYCRMSMLKSQMKIVDNKINSENDEKVGKKEKEKEEVEGKDDIEGKDVSEKSDAEDMISGENIYKSILDRWGTKMSHLVKYLHQIFKEDSTNQAIIFSQWNKMLNMVGHVLNDSGIKHVYCKGNVWTITKSISKFKRDPNIRVIMLSSETCSSGNNLTEASHIVLLDTANTSKENALAIENQAVGRAVRLGQKKSVQVVRFIIKDTIEEEYYKRNYINQV